MMWFQYRPTNCSNFLLLNVTYLYSIHIDKKKKKKKDHKLLKIILAIYFFLNVNYYYFILYQNILALVILFI